MNGIIRFSVLFCDNSLLVLKMGFQVFSFVSKKVEGFSSDSQCQCRFNHCSYLQNRVSIFLDFNFKPRYLGKCSLCP